MPSPATSRLIGPVLAAAAALFAGGVWLVPQRVLTPDAAPPAPVTPAGQLKPAYVPPAKETRWPLLAAKLEPLREPWKGPDPSEVATSDQPSSQPETTLSWEYVGMVDAAKLRAAMIVVNNVQRFVSVGETVPDPSFPGAVLRVKSIESDKLEVEHGDSGSGTGKARISTVPRKQPSPATITPTVSDGRPGVPPRPGVPTPGLTSGGGRGVPNTPGMKQQPRPSVFTPGNPVPGAPFPNTPGATPVPTPTSLPTPPPAAPGIPSPVPPPTASPVPSAAPTGKPGQPPR